MIRSFLLVCFSVVLMSCQAQNLPDILSDKKVQKEHYLPDFSYAGYKNGTATLPQNVGRVVNAADHGVIANDELDDSKALIKLIDSLKTIDEPLVLKLPAGRIILSDIIYLERSNFVLKGMGSGDNGTELFFPRPMMYVEDPEPLAELREYLQQFDKVQREKENNIELSFSQYAWSGGFIWTQVPDERVKSYLKKYDQPVKVLAQVSSGKRGSMKMNISLNSGLKVGDVVELQLFNKDGKGGQIITELYKDADVKVGTHHYNFPDLPIVRQQVRISKINKSSIEIETPLTVDVKEEYAAILVEWKHLEQVGIQDFKITFPMTPRVAHHVEQGWNGINLTRLYDSWVDNIIIENADSGILTEEIANVTISNITTTGDHYAHYTVAMAGVHNVLAENIVVKNKAEHPLSFNTFSTKNVYKDCKVFVDPVLDQHSGANHQNLFDNITVHVKNIEDNTYGLFKGGGAGYWKPSHGAYSTFYNIEVIAENPDQINKSLVLNGMKDGTHARLIGVHGNVPVEVDYGPDAYLEKINSELENVPSLYEYQLSKRKKL